MSGAGKDLERRVHERCTDSGRSTLTGRTLNAAICFTHFLSFFFFFRTLYLFKEHIVLSVLPTWNSLANCGQHWNKLLFKLNKLSSMLMWLLLKIKRMGNEMIRPMILPHAQTCRQLGEGIRQKTLWPLILFYALDVIYQFNFLITTKQEFQLEHERASVDSLTRIGSFASS